MFGTSRFSSGARVAKSQDDTFELGSRSSSMDNSSAAEDVLGSSESPFPRTTFAGFPPPTEDSSPPPIDAPENKTKFTGTVSSASRRSFAFTSLFTRPRKQRQSSTSSLSSVDSSGYQL